MNKNTILWLLLLAPLSSISQGLKANLYDKFLKKQRVETEALPMVGLEPKNKLAVSFTALGPALSLTLDGSGWGTGTVDLGDELILLFSNDSVMTLHSPSLQSFVPGTVQNSYRHQYQITPSQLEALSRFDLTGIRKYSFTSFSDLKVPAANAGKLKSLSDFFVAELKKANIFKTLRPINVKDVLAHIGDSVQFCSTVFKTRYFNESEEKPTLLDVQADFSDPFVTVVIPGSEREDFNGAPEKKFLNKQVCISGVLTLRNNIPHLVVYNRDQIKVTSPVSLSEIDLFVGDSVTVAGKVFTARYLEDSKTKPTLLNVGDAYPQQPLTLVIESEDRPGFDRPEEVYLNKTLQVSGRVSEFKGKPQMVLHHPQQVQVVADEGPMAAFAAAEDPPVMQTAVTTSAHEAKAKLSEAEEKVTDAVFPGGQEAFARFVRDRLLAAGLLQLNEQRRIVAIFELDTAGACTQVTIRQSAGEALDKEIKKVLMAMPRWTPAARGGVAVPITVTAPLTLSGGEGGSPRKP